MCVPNCIPRTCFRYKKKNVRARLSLSEFLGTFFSADISFCKIRDTTGLNGLIFREIGIVEIQIRKCERQIAYLDLVLGIKRRM
jgi:hypothetical protein